jgi:hypothetical protein
MTKPDRVPDNKSGDVALFLEVKAGGHESGKSDLSKPGKGRTQMVAAGLGAVEDTWVTASGSGSAASMQGEVAGDDGSEESVDVRDCAGFADLGRIAEGAVLSETLWRAAGGNPGGEFPERTQK